MNKLLVSVVTVITYKAMSLNEQIIGISSHSDKKLLVSVVIVITNYWYQ